MSFGDSSGSGPGGAPPDMFAAIEELGPEELAKAMEFLETLSHGLFPAGEPGAGQMTWPDRPDVALLTADGQIRTTEEKLRAAEARFHTLVEQIPAVTFMAVLGEGENEMYVSPHIEQMLGYTQEEWLSDPFLWYNRLHPEDRALWNQEFARGCYSGGPFRAECRFRARDGRVVWVHGEARLVRDPLGRPQFLQGVAFDITESKEAQKLLLEGAVRQARIDEELEIARRVQVALVPENPQLEGLEMAVVMVPADEVGGDYYDVQPTDFGGWIAIGDVSGHGLNAGLVMLMLQSAMFTVQQSMPKASPGEALGIVNRTIYKNVAERLKRKEYVTTNLLRYERSGRVVFAGGHQYIVVCRADGDVFRMQTPGPWLGIRENMPYAADHELFLARGDLVVLYTDGIIEARDKKGRLYEMDRLCDVIGSNYKGSVSEIRDAVMASVRSFMHEQEDDMTLLVMRYVGERDVG
jgi:PAS domain S-box-containing protein